MGEYPSPGLLTFLFTDLEGSTNLWEQFPDTMRSALVRHDLLLKQTVEAHRGHVVKTTGDGVHAVFESPADGVAAALAAPGKPASLSRRLQNWSINSPTAPG